MTDEIILNQRQAAYALDVTTRTLRSWDDLPEPPPRTQGKRGQPNAYPLRDLVVWYLDYRISQLIGDVDGEVLDLTQEKAKLAKAQTRKLELDLAEREKRLFPPDRLLADFQKMVSYSRQHLLGLPTKAAPTVYGCQSIAETAEEIRVHVYDALTSLSDTPFKKVLEWNPDGDELQ